ncbi:hypothetical protein AGMMS49928_13080 [Spirochaetia bacterium]|nr:hypothetical protein AGMMS49928_13080 [Spirochaetia bacterium]
MDRHELLQKISTFPLVAGVLAEDLLAGNYRSIFKGQGIEFDEVRHYEQGDDIRSIDWNVSARFGTPYVKMYREERELTAAIVLDCSASMHTGAGKNETQAGQRLSAGQSLSAVSRYDQALLAAALVAFSAERAGQRVGGVFFDREITRIFPPKKGRSHVMALISGALRVKNAGKGSELGKALVGAGRLLKRRSLVVLISDFQSLNWEMELGDLARNHDVIALRIRDPLETEMPSMGLFSFVDPETGVKVSAPTGFDSFRSGWTAWQTERAGLWEAICRHSGAGCLELSTADDAAAVLMRFFAGRKTPRRMLRNTGGPPGGRPA